jgi:hypothetical protein
LARNLKFEDIKFFKPSVDHCNLQNKQSWIITDYASTGETMRDELLNATIVAIKAVDAARFFQTERGFHGQFYCALQNQIEQAGLMTNGAILEMEYQKSRRHGTWQRPDIVFHIPVEHSGASVGENNFAVWALKRRASITDAVSDFALLDDMFETLRYPLGFFVNVDSTDQMGQHYTGEHPDRLATVAAKLIDAQVTVNF